MKHCDSGKFASACLYFGLVALASLLLTSLATQSAAIAQAAGGATPTRAELVAVDIGWLELVGGGPLTPDERQQAAEAVDISMQANPKVFLQDYAIGSKLLQRVAKDSGRLVLVDWNESSGRFEQEVYTQSVRQQARFAIETTTPHPGLERGDAIENSIIRRHDPTVVIDPARKHIISEINLRLLDDASAWYAQNVGLPGPSIDFKNHLRIWIKENYLKTNADVAEALCDEPHNFLYLTDAFKGLQHNAADMEALRTAVKGGDPLTRDVSLAIAVSAASRVANARVQQALNKMNQAVAQSMGAIGYGTVVQQTQGALWHH